MFFKASHMFCANFLESQMRSKMAIVIEKSIYSVEWLTIWLRDVRSKASVSGVCPMMSASFLYSGDDAAVMSELLHCR